MKMAKILIVIFFLLWPVGVSFAEDWPKVRPMEAEVGFDTKMSRFDFRVPIYGVNGKPLYWFLCKAGHEDDPDNYNDFEYGSGLLACRLGLYQKGFNNFLAEDDQAVWYTRGSITTSQLLGQCGKYPEYGRVRNFRLRGFKLTIEMKSLVIKSDKLEYFIMKISVVSDPSATRRRAESTGYLRPGREGCKKILKGTEPRYCRNPETLSWGKCVLR